MNRLFDPYRLDARLDAAGGAVPPDAVRRTEAKLAALTGRRRCLLVSSGRDALKAALKATGIRKGSTVAMTNLTHPSAPEAAAWAGAAPLFAEISARNLNISGAALRAAVRKADALLLTHMFSASAGAAAAGRACAAAGIPLVEDASQIIGESEKGRPYGSFGLVSVFSLSPYKPVSCPGHRAGALLCDDEKVFSRLKRLAADFPPPPPAAAARLLWKLELLPSTLERLGLINAAYRAAFSGLRGVALPKAGPRAHEFPLLTSRRDGLLAALKRAGIPPERTYEPFNSCYGAPGAYPASAAYAREAVQLPVYPLMTEGETEHVIRTVKNFFER